MQPRLTIHARAAASVTTGKSAVRPLPREDDVHGLEPVGMRLRHALLVEEFALDAVRVPLHLHRPARDVVQDVRCEGEVVGDEIALRQTPLGEEDLVEIRERELAPTDPHGRRG
jgi:hypothetical protein